MPRLQILQHKSYHPYLETNKQRVRDDEAKAAALEAEEERAALNEVCFSPLFITKCLSIQQNSTSRLAYLRDKDSFPPPSSSCLIDPPDASALLAARRSEKIRADKREEKRRLEYDWPKEEKRTKERQGKRKDKNGEGEVGPVGHVNFWAGQEKVRWIDFVTSWARPQVRSGLGRENVGLGNPSLSLCGWPKNFKGERRPPSHTSTTRYGVGFPTLNLRPHAHRNGFGFQSATTAKPGRTPDQIQADDPTTMYLNRPLRETRPWYTDVELRTFEERDEDEEKRERRERRR
jgi:hypothetical protein